MELKEAYSCCNPEKAIAFQNESEPQDKKLMVCIEKRFLANRDYEQLKCYLETLVGTYQKNFAALGRALLRLPSNLSWETTYLNLDVALFMARLQLHTRMKSTLTPCRAAIDVACVRSLGQWKSNGQTPTQWFTCYRRVAEMLLGADMATRALLEKELYGVLDDLTELVNSPQLGAALSRRP